MKQTAVEWLVDRLPTIDKNDPYYEDIIQQAKAMEKEQIMDIDYRLSVIEDYAKGEAGDEITKLRKYIDETYGN